jgi:tetratricopeptide (TPR) repeat protein
MAPDESPPRARSSLPSKIGRYRILDRVGRGAMGVVYAARDDAMGRNVAVKVLMADLESDPETRARFYREAQAAAGLLHPNIITIYDAGEDQGRSYIAMQLLEGWPLATYLKQSDAALVVKLDLMIQMCEGLAVAHARGIVHRDIKPGNLFVQSDGLLKILDFGVARLADSSMTAAGSLLGTPDYMSPEQARGTQVDTRSDIFSAGAVFYFMLTGRKPFPGPDLPAVLHQLQFEDPVPLSDVEAPPELAGLVVKAMSKEPGDRPARVQELLASIVRFKRSYHAETRKLAADAGAKYAAVMAADAEWRRLTGILDLPDQPDVSDVLRALRERFPVLDERGSVGLESVAFDRPRLTQLAAELDGERRRLDDAIADRGRLVSLLEEGQRALAGGDPRAARSVFERLCSECPSSRRAHSLADECVERIRELEARDREVNALTQEARGFLEVRNWTQAIATCDRAVSLAGELPQVVSILKEAQQGIAREQRRKALLVQQSLDRAAISIEEGRFEDAEAALSDAEALDPSGSAVASVRNALIQARAAAAEAELIQLMTADEIRRARAAFRRGHYDAALTGLRVFVEAQSDTSPAATEMVRLSALRDRVVASAQERHRQAMALMSAAKSLADRGAFKDALAKSRDAVLCDVSDSEAVSLFADLVERDLRARIELARADAREAQQSVIAPMLAAVREAEGRGYVALALEGALSACRLAPDRADISTLVEELRGIAASDDSEAFDLVDEPFVRPEPPMAQPRPTLPPRVRPAEPIGLFSHLNQWAANLWRRRILHR